MIKVQNETWRCRGSATCMQHPPCCLLVRNSCMLICEKYCANLLSTGWTSCKAHAQAAAHALRLSCMGPQLHTSFTGAIRMTHMNTKRYIVIWITVTTNTSLYSIFANLARQFCTAQKQQKRSVVADHMFAALTNRGLQRWCLWNCHGLQSLHGLWNCHGITIHGQGLLCHANAMREVVPCNCRWGGAPWRDVALGPA